MLNMFLCALPGGCCDDSRESEGKSQTQPAGTFKMQTDAQKGFASNFGTTFVILSFLLGKKGGNGLAGHKQD